MGNFRVSMGSGTTSPTNGMGGIKQWYDLSVCLSVCLSHVLGDFNINRVYQTAISREHIVSPCNILFITYLESTISEVGMTFWHTTKGGISEKARTTVLPSFLHWKRMLSILAWEIKGKILFCEQNTCNTNWAKYVRVKIRPLSLQTSSVRMCLCW